MTTTTYRDGELAVLTIKATLNETRAVRVAMPQGMQWMTIPSGSFFNDDEVSDVGPLVALDPADDDGDRHRVAAALMSWWDANRSDLGMARGTGHTAGVALQAAGHMLNYLATPTTDAEPSEQVAATEALAEWTGSLGRGQFFLYQPPRDSIDVLDEILAELRRIGDRFSKTTGASAKGRRTEVTHGDVGSVANWVTVEPPEGSSVTDKKGVTWVRSSGNGKWNCLGDDSITGSANWSRLVEGFGPLVLVEMGAR